MAQKRNKCLTLQSVARSAVDSQHHCGRHNRLLIWCMLLDTPGFALHIAASPAFASMVLQRVFVLPAHVQPNN